MNDPFSRSIQIIKANQTHEGAYIAGPGFSQYSRYCWFRDGAYIAYAMDLAGEHDSAFRFYDWAAGMIAAHASQVERAVAAARSGNAPPPDAILHTRYAVDGGTSDEEWPNFQLDGFGTLLWGMSRHLTLTGRSLAEAPAVWREAVVLLVSYLSALWRLPCYDCWEEFGDKIHTYTLAALYGGLRASCEMLASPGALGAANADADRALDAVAAAASQAADTASQIKLFVLGNCVLDGAFCKFVGDDAVDGNLIFVAVPYGLVATDDPVMAATSARIEADLRRAGHGVHRYTDDSYYGGGEWILLTAYLGWYYLERGDKESARALLAWIERQAHADGALPEQVPCHLNHPDMLLEWEERWGQIATPLIWSHAAYVTLSVGLQG